MIEFVWPHSSGEWMAWCSAVYLVATGLIILIAPQIWTNLLGSGTPLHLAGNKALIRGPVGGFYTGIGLIALMLHPQPLVYLAIGAAFLFSAIGRFLSIWLDGGSNLRWLFFVVVEVVLGFLPLAYVFGVVS